MPSPSPMPTIVVSPPAGSPAWVSGLFILGGAVLGGGVALFSTWLSDRRKVEAESNSAAERVAREDRQRWDQIAVELCAALLVHAYEYQRRALIFRAETDRVRAWIARPTFLGSLRHFFRSPTLLFALSLRREAIRAQHKLDLDVAQLRFLRPTLHLPATALLISINKQADPATDDETFQEMLGGYRSLRSTFIDLATHELGVFLPYTPTLVNVSEGVP